MRCIGDAAVALSSNRLADAAQRLDEAKLMIEHLQRDAQKEQLRLSL